MQWFRLAVCVLLLTMADVRVQAADPKEEDYYPLTEVPLPQGETLEIGALEMLPSGQLALSTRRGEVWLIDEPLGNDPARMKSHRFAHGLHEVLGLAWRDGWLYVTQRCDVSRIQDHDGDGVADRFEVVSDGWEIGGDYHEYAFGSRFDRDGNIWVVLCLTGSYGSDVKYRGWCLRITPEGNVIPTCSGIRSPGGIGMNANGEVFYTDNQGPWNGTCALKHLVPGKFMGHPGGNRWYELDEVKAAMPPRPVEPESGSRFMTEAARIADYEPPVILFPYKKMGQSASGIACDESAGKFGPFSGQMFVGDQTNSTIMRCDLEEVDGHYQGACFPFREGFGSGNLAVFLTDTGSMFVGGTNRGWGSRGSKNFALERVDWTGKVPFEVLTMRALPDGFRLTFTQPVDAATAADLASYQLESYAYIYQSDYGSPEVDQSTPKLTKATVAADGQSVDLQIDGLETGKIVELRLPGVRNRDSVPLLHQEAYYTLNRLPAKQ